MNADICDLDERLARYVPEPLRYPCRCWHLHVIEDPGDPVVQTQMKVFLFTHLLHWIEVMSLLGEIHNVFSVLRDMKAWFEVSSDLMSVSAGIDQILAFCYIAPSRI
jgi:hypothetical protein